MADDGVPILNGMAGICAYCGQPALSGDEKPEHAIPAALGASLIVDTVCDPCNGWAGKEVDQPFLEDDWVRLHRSQSGVVDPRRGRKSRPISSPMMQGLTEEGDFVSLDANGTPKMRSRIVDLGDQKFQIRAGSMEEMERLKRRIERKTGKEITDETIRHFSSNPRINWRMSVGTLAWLRQAAKIALAVSSKVYPEQWRTGADAARLREWLNGKDALVPAGQAIGLVPRQVTGTPVERFVSGADHLIFFQRAKGMTGLTIVLLGSVFAWLPVDTTDAPTPRIAWKLDPARPKASGETTFDLLLAQAAQWYLTEASSLAAD
jgi:HNH endonuclease